MAANTDDMLMDRSEFFILPTRRTKSLPAPENNKLETLDKAEDFTAATTSHAMASAGLGHQTDVDQVLLSI
jgi:hypothetical protein